METLPLIFTVLAVAMLGVSKAGFGGVGTALALPLMSLGLPPEVALGVLLPLLLATDVVSIASHRKNMDLPAIAYALPGGIVGVGMGAFVIDFASPDMIAGAIGVLAIFFAIVGFLDRNPDVSGWPGWVGSLFGWLSGFTSTLAHAGGPPIHIYYLAKGYSPQVFVATSAGFMAGINLLKLGPYLFIGTLDWAAMKWALALAPVAVIAAYGGVYMARNVSKSAFKLAVNVLMVLAGVKLLFDAFT